MKRILTIIYCFCLTLFSVQAESLDSINARAFQAYSNQQYEEAIALYSQLSDTVQRADVYYNLGCSYYRNEDIAHAILNFERAHRMNPSNEDYRFNLEYARSKTIDKIAPKHEMFLIAFYHSLVQMFTITQWAYVSAVCFVLALLMVLVYIYGKRMLWRKIAFGMSIFLFFITLCGNIFAWQQSSIDSDVSAAVITAPAVTAKSMPSESGNDLFVLHAGTTVDVTDDTMKEWCEISLSDGKVGWVQKNALDMI